MRLDGIRKTYRIGDRAVEALRGVDMTIDEPGSWAIMGPSGSGKSTLLHLLGALDSPDSGTIEMAGERLDELDERRLTQFRRRRIGIVFQQFNLVPTLSALDNITLPAMLDGVAAGVRRKRGLALLDELGLTARAEHRPDALSGGEQQRIAIARALYFEPGIVLADEPTGNLDSATSEQIWTLLAKITKTRELTMLMVTHEPAAAAHCRHVFLLRDGLVDDSFDTDGLDAAELATRAQSARR